MSLTYNTDNLIDVGASNKRYKLLVYYIPIFLTSFTFTSLHKLSFKINHNQLLKLNIHTYLFLTVDSCTFTILIISETVRLNS